MDTIKSRDNVITAYKKAHVYKVVVVATTSDVQTADDGVPAYESIWRRAAATDRNDGRRR